MADNLAMLSWLFRPQCAACGASEAPLCESCRASLAELGPACPRCAAPTGEAAILCRRCVREPLAIEQIIAPWRFGGQLASAIRRLKFTGATHVARTLAPLWAPVLAAAARDTVVVPVPSGSGTVPELISGNVVVGIPALRFG